MAEMTVAQSIGVLHNNQYQKHIGNGEYDYIHPLTDAEAKLIEKLIEQQAQEIERLNKSLKFEQNYLSRVGTHGPDCYKWGPGHWDCAVQEIAKKDRMLEKACELLAFDSVASADHWRLMIEKEAEVQG